MGALGLFVALVMELSSPFQAIGVHDGVIVYEAPNERVITLRAEGEFEASPAEVQAVLLDYDSHPRLVKHLVESRIIEKHKDEIVVYQRLELPVIKDRDFTLQVRWDKDSPTRTVQTRVNNQLGPLDRRNIVHMAMLNGDWELEPIRGGTATFARYTVQIDFAGTVPRWMVRGGAAKDLPGMFQRFRNEVAVRRSGR